MQHLPCFLVPSRKLAKVLIKYWTCRKCMFCGINQQPLGAKPIRTSRKLIESSFWDYWSWWNEGETRRKKGIRILCADHHVSLHFPISILIYISYWCWYNLRIQWVLKKHFRFLIWHPFAIVGFSREKASCQWELEITSKGPEKEWSEEEQN